MNISTQQPKKKKGETRAKCEDLLVVNLDRNTERWSDWRMLMRADKRKLLLLIKSKTVSEQNY